MGVIADRRLWWNADKSRVVEDGSQEAAFLACAPGDELNDDEARALGLKARGKPADKQADPSANKSGSGVTINKRS